MKKITESGPDLYTLVDEKGVEQKYALLDVMEVDNRTYYALVPNEDKEGSSTDVKDFLLVLKKEMVDGEEVLVTIEDNDEFNKIGQMFLDRIDEELKTKE